MIIKIKALIKMYLIEKKSAKYDKLFNYYFDKNSVDCFIYFRALCRCQKLIKNIHKEAFK